MSERTAVHVFVEGAVQGVFFRATTQEQAQQTGVDGWVRNLPDGRVEAHFEGESEAVEAMVSFCHEGSPTAEVDSVEVEWVDPYGYDGFEIRR